MPIARAAINEDIGQVIGQGLGRGPGRATARDFRAIVLVLSLLTVALGVWILAATWLQPGSARTAGWPAYGRTPQFGAAQKSRAGLAARLGVVRADLWAEDALMQSDYDLNTGAPSAGVAPPSANIAAARAAAERALSLAPIAPEIWLLLAALSPETPGVSASERKIAALQMAYLTGEGVVQLLPARLMIAARGPALADKTIQDFVRMDIDYILLKAPKLKLALLAAYQAATPGGRAFLAQAIKTDDPAFLSTLH